MSWPGDEVTLRTGPPAPTQGHARTPQPTMSNAWSDSATKDVLYPDDLPGYGPVQVVSEPIEAEDVPSEEARYGLFAELGGDSPPQYMATPIQVRSLIGDAVESEGGLPVVVEVFEAERGPSDDDPWEIDGRVVEDGDPL